MIERQVRAPGRQAEKVQDFTCNEKNELCAAQTKVKLARHADGRQTDRWKEQASIHK